MSTDRLPNALRLVKAKPLTLAQTDSSATFATFKAMQLMRQIEETDDACAMWLISLLTALASKHPQMTVGDLLQMAKQAMPAMAESYATFTEFKS